MLLCLAVVCLTVFVGAFNILSRSLTQSLDSEHLETKNVILQDNANNCGPAALLMVFQHYGITASLRQIERKAQLTEKGSSLLALKEIAEANGLKAEGWWLSAEDLFHTTKPAIVFVFNSHFVVIDSTVSNRYIYMRDPARGSIKMHKHQLSQIWTGQTLVLWRDRPSPGNMSLQR